MAKIKSKYEQLIERFQDEGRVQEVDSEKSEEIIANVEKEVDEYRFENQKRMRESQEEVATVVLNS